MSIFSAFRSVTVFTLAAGLAFASAPAQAAPTPEQQTQCLALGVVFSELAVQEAELIKTFRDTTTNATVEDEETIKELEALQKDTAEIGSILQEIYAEATPPTTQALDILRNTKIDALADQLDACVPD